MSSPHTPCLLATAALVVGLGMGSGARAGMPAPAGTLAWAADDDTSVVAFDYSSVAQLSSYGPTWQLHFDRAWLVEAALRFAHTTSAAEQPTTFSSQADLGLGAAPRVLQIDLAEGWCLALAPFAVVQLVGAVSWEDGTHQYLGLTGRGGLAVEVAASGLPWELAVHAQLNVSVELPHWAVVSNLYDDITRIGDARLRVGLVLLFNWLDDNPTPLMLSGWISRSLQGSDDSGMGLAMGLVY